MTSSGLPKTTVTDEEEITLAEIRKLIKGLHPESQFVVLIYKPGGPTGMSALADIKMDTNLFNKALDELMKAAKDDSLYHRKGASN